MSFIPEGIDRLRVPVAIISGFLGSGKTTLINALLKDPQLHGTAVAINEFGEVPIDQHLIDHGQDKTIVMANGCLCCNLAGDMEQAVMRLFSRKESGDIPQFDRLIVEPSGLSDPAPLAHSILRQPLLSRAFTLKSIVTLVDATLAQRHIGKFSEVTRQVQLADRIVITKSDLVDASQITQIEREISQINGLAARLVGKVDPQDLFPPDFIDSAQGSDATVDWISRGRAFEEGERGRGNQDAGPHAHGRVCSVSVTWDGAVAWRPLEEWIRGIRLEHGERLLRMKGIARLRGRTRPIAIQAVGHVQSVPVELEDWPDDGHRIRIVFIGDGLDTSAIRRSWNQFVERCASEAELHSEREEIDASH